MNINDCMRRIRDVLTKQLPSDRLVAILDPSFFPKADEELVLTLRAIAEKGLEINSVNVYAHKNDRFVTAKYMKLTNILDAEKYG